MADIGISNELFKENLMSLSMDDKLVKDLESLDTSTKTAFTKEYNKKHSFNVTGVTRKTGGKSTGNKSAKLDADITADND
jgi:hypothetical protein